MEYLIGAEVFWFDFHETINTFHLDKNPVQIEMGDPIAALSRRGPRP